MLHKTAIALLAVMSIGLASPTMALARGGGGGRHGGGMGGGGGFHGGGFGGGGFHGGNMAGGFHGGSSFGGFRGSGFYGHGFHGRGFGNRFAFGTGLGYGFYDPYYYDDYATATVIRTPTRTLRAILTLKAMVAMSFNGACTPCMVGAGNPFRCAVDAPSRIGC